MFEDTIFCSQTGPEITNLVGVAAFRNGSDVHIQAAPEFLTALPAPTVFSERAPPLHLCGPIFLRPRSGARPESFPAEAISLPLMISRLSGLIVAPGQVVIDPKPSPRYGKPVILAESFNSVWERSVHHSIQPLSANEFTLKKPIGQLDMRRGKLLFMDCQHRGHFGHFFADVLSIAWAYQHLLSIGIVDLKVFVTESLKEYMLCLLEAAGIPQHAVVRIDRAFLCEDIFLASKCFATQGYTTPFSTALWQKIRILLDDGDGPEKIYVSRRHAAGRVLINEAEIEALFESRGFQIVYPERESISRQISLFANARFIAGASGSNMFNLAFQKSLQKSLILFSPNFIRFSELLIQAGQNIATYFYVGDSDNTSVHGSWTINLSLLQQQLDRWLAA